MGTVSGRRFDAAPLLAKLELSFDPATPRVARNCVSHAAKVLGVTRHAIYKVRRRGLSEFQADELAVRAGWHPTEIWDDWSQGVIA